MKRLILLLMLITLPGAAFALEQSFIAITRKIIESHRGTLQVESGPGYGTTVTVRLPLQDAANGGIP